MQLAIFFQREFIAAHGFEFGLALEALVCWNIAFADGKVHGRIECAHFKADSGIADLCAMASLAILAPPSWISCPAILTHQMNLCATDITV